MAFCLAGLSFFGSTMGLEGGKDEGMEHLLTIEGLSREEILQVVHMGQIMKRQRGRHVERPLHGQIWALLFMKSSTRTRVSFEVGIRELGGEVIFLSGGEIQLGRGEPIRDTARVLGRMVHGAVIRTYAQRDVEEFARLSGIATINALTDEEHPCQILADLQTIQELRGSLEGLRVCFVGDGDCNVARSWLWAAARLGFELRLAAPERFRPPEWLLKRVREEGGKVNIFSKPEEAAAGVDVIYTDVWVSMGKEEESAFRMAQLQGYQVNRKLLEVAPAALVMHCLPAYREKEITDEVMEQHAETIFLQAENRLHSQKAILAMIMEHRREKEKRGGKGVNLSSGGGEK
ncbi:MAG: ornithine carbamoyltransferase [Chthoniobacterales bacterium]|nr:ornithine carbamoyltransferase [Chthoniobacterales bacterium]